METNTTNLSEIDTKHGTIEDPHVTEIFEMVKDAFPRPKGMNDYQYFYAITRAVYESEPDDVSLAMYRHAQVFLLCFVGAYLCKYKPQTFIGNDTRLAVLLIAKAAANSIPDDDTDKLCEMLFAENYPSDNHENLH